MTLAVLQDKWTSEDEESLAHAVCKIEQSLGKNERWKEISKLVGNGHGKNDCYARWKEVNKNTKKKKATPTSVSSPLHTKKKRSSYPIGDENNPGNARFTAESKAADSDRGKKDKKGCSNWKAE